MPYAISVMVLAIFTLILISTISYLVTMVYGYLAQSDPSYSLSHITLGLPAALLTILTHCIAMFYFIGSGKTLKEAVARHKLSPTYNEQSRKIKMITSPLQTYTAVAVVVMTCFGGAASVGKMNPLYHHIMAWVTFALHLWTSVQTVRYTIANQLLGADAVAEIQKLEKAG